MLRHFQDSVYGLLLGGINERTGIHHDDIRVFGVDRDTRAPGLQHTHHDLAIDEVLGAAQTDETDLQRSFGFGF